MSNAEVLAALIEHLALTATPAIAACTLMIRRGVRSTTVLIVVALLTSGLVGIGSFWAYYADPAVGKVFAWLVLLGSAGAIAWVAWRGGTDRKALRGLRSPLLLWLLGSTFIVFFGFLHGGADQAIGMSSTRFSGQLPSDND